MRIVANSDGCRGFIPFQMIENLFVNLFIAGHGVHPPSATSLGHVLEQLFYPLHKFLHFLNISQMHQGVYREGGISDPGIPVVPISFSAYVFWEAESGGGYYGTITVGNQ